MVQSMPSQDGFHEECAVFGIAGSKEAANLTYLGLYALQHRGQEGSGIVSSDGEQFFQKKPYANFREPRQSGITDTLRQAVDSCKTFNLCPLISLLAIWPWLTMGI